MEPRPQLTHTESLEESGARVRFTLPLTSPTKRPASTVESAGRAYSHPVTKAPLIPIYQNGEIVAYINDYRSKKLKDRLKKRHFNHAWTIVEHFPEQQAEWAALDPGSPTARGLRYKVIRDTASIISKPSQNSRL